MFKVGDVCVVNALNAASRGLVVTLVRPLSQLEMHGVLLSKGINGNPNKDSVFWEVDELVVWYLGESGITFNIPYSEQKILTKLDDGNKTASWEECIWKPKDLKVEI